MTKTGRLQELDLSYGDGYLEELRETPATDAKGVLSAVRRDGYALLRGFYERDDVLAARNAILRAVASTPGCLAEGYPVEEGRVGPEPYAYIGAGVDLVRLEAFRDVVCGERITSFFDEMFGEPSVTLDTKFLRLIGPGGATPAHCDRVFFGVATDQLVTGWVPFTDIPLERGPLTLLVGSTMDDRIRETYAAEDVDRDGGPGYLAVDPIELANTTGGRWATAEFEPGDLLLFGMYTVHTSLINTTDVFRITCDVRFQPVSLPADGRWLGERQIRHYRHTGLVVEAVTRGRERWRIPIGSGADRR